MKGKREVVGFRRGRLEPSRGWWAGGFEGEGRMPAATWALLCVMEQFCRRDCSVLSRRLFCVMLSNDVCSSSPASSVAKLWGFGGNLREVDKERERRQESEKERDEVSLIG